MATLSIHRVNDNALTKFEYSYYNWIYGISSVNLNSICKFVHKAVKALDDACLNLLEREALVVIYVELM